MPDEVLNAMHRSAIDIYSGELVGITDSCLEDLREVFRTERLAGDWRRAVEEPLRADTTGQLTITDRFILPSSAGLLPDISALLSNERRHDTVECGIVIDGFRIYPRAAGIWVGIEDGP